MDSEKTINLEPQQGQAVYNPSSVPGQPPMQPGHGYPQQQGVYPYQCYPQQQVVVVERGERTSDCLVVSILNCIFCNCIVGIVAIIFSVKARDDFDEGRMESGRRNAKIAQGLNICMPVTSILIGVITAICVYTIGGSFYVRIG